MYGDFVDAHCFIEAGNEIDVDKDFIVNKTNFLVIEVRALEF